MENINTVQKKSKIESFDIAKSDETMALAVDLAKFIKENRLYQNVQGKEYVNVEIFFFVPGLPFNYQISNTGKVYSLPRVMVKSDGRKKTMTGKILKSGLSSTGYQVVYIRDENHKKKVFKIHQLVAKAFVHNPLNKPIINHLDGNKLNNYYKNLEWCTYSENLQHAYKNDLRTANTEAAIQTRRKIK